VGIAAEPYPPLSYAPVSYQPVVSMGGRMVAVAARGLDILDLTCGQVAEWRRRPGWERLAISVSVSALELADPGLADRLASALRDHGLPSDAAKLTTAYGSLVGQDVVRKGLTFQVVRLEHCVVGGLGRNSVDAAIAESMIALAHHLGLLVVADGVEWVGQLDVLRELGCDFGQGSYWSPPVCAEGLGLVLDEWSATGLPITAG
jgi:EAL domain-containing protein (putative c-di-GMP-specific phosphodiesterase class I)